MIKMSRPLPRNVLISATMLVSIIFLAPTIVNAEPKAGSGLSVTPTTTSNQVANVDCTTYKPASSSFLAFPSWDKYIKNGKTDLNGKCTTPSIGLTDKSGKFSGTGILLVLLAVIDILMRLVGLVALGFIVFGGIKYVTSQGSPEGTKDAQGTVLNALIGIGIATIAVAVVSFLGSKIG